jgi:acetoin utilization deacetylase AcuC-like enzyme
MAGGTGIVLDERMLAHDPGRGHPERPDRLRVLQQHLGDARALVHLEARPATEEELTLVHTPALVDRVAASAGRPCVVFDPDTRTSAGSWEAACLAAGGLIDLCEAVLAGDLQNGVALVRPPGHHAERARAMGFCLFNNVAIAARFLRRRVLIVDWDVHHGNGTQDTFEDDPTVWYLSTHRYPFYPGTGSALERGAGNIVNLPMDIDTPREEVLQVFGKAVRKAAKEFKPEFLLVSCGFDAYEGDPIGGLNLKPEDYRTMTDVVCGLGIPVVSALEGGYSLTGLGPCAQQHAEGLLDAGRKA